MKSQIDQELDERCWKAGDGRDIPYSKLEDSHLKAIIHDGYRNPWIEAEARKRKFKIPVRPVDKLSHAEISTWMESFASCAIEGNALGTKMSNLFQTDWQRFAFHLNRILVREAERKASSPDR